MRLVRELLAADAEPDLAPADATTRASRFLEVVSRGLDLCAGAILLRRTPDGQLECIASTLCEPARALLLEPSGRTMALLRKVGDERRALLMRAASDDRLLAVLREADANIGALAILPLADRAPVGVLVLAASENALATETIRTLNPALRLLALLVSPLRDGAPSDRGLRRELEESQAQSEKRGFEVAQLRARIDELEARLASMPAEPELTARGVAIAAAVTSRKIENLVTAAETGEPTDAGPRVVVVVDASRVWEGYAVHDHVVTVVAPSSDLVSQVRALAPARVVMNLVAPGALESLVALHTGSQPLSVYGVIADTTSERVVGLGMVDALGRSPTVEALVMAVDRQAPRNARVLAAGRDAEVLMKMRQLLTKQGFSVSMARDTKQISELVDMVRPQTIVVDLQLPMREGYELVMRASSLSPIPGVVMVLPEGDPVPMLVDKMRDRLTAGKGMGAKQWLADLVAKKIALFEHRAKSAAGAGRPV